MLYDKKIVNRIKRTEGQMRGVLAMMENDKQCQDVVTQLSAIRSSIDRTIGLVVAENLVHCVTNPDDGERSSEDKVQEAIKLLIKSR